MPVVGMDHFSSHLRHTENMDAVASFYEHLGFEVLHGEEYRAGLLDKRSVRAGEHKYNLRGATDEYVLPHVGWLWEGGIPSLLAHLDERGVDIYRGPVPVTGGRDGGNARCIVVAVLDPEGAIVAFVSYDEEDLARYGGPTYEESYRAAAMAAEAEPPQT